MAQTVFTKLADKYPFITLCLYGGVEYVGIVQNRDDLVTTIYDYGAIADPALKTKFVELANEWWWESSRLIPINIFLKEDWMVFKPFLRTFSNKDLEIIHGPTISLTDLAKRKSKRRSITLVRKQA